MRKPTDKVNKSTKSKPPYKKLQKDTEKILKPIENHAILKENIANKIDNSPITTDNLLQEKELQRVIKKKQYRQFMRLVKEGKYTSAVVSARIIGVTRQTIGEWMKTKRVIKAMEQDVNKYIDRIETSRDWKAQAYLLDKLEGSKDEQESKQELQQLIVINT